MTTIEWVKGEDGSNGMSWNALRAVREIMRKGKPFTASANHCEHVNEACRFCYAEKLNARLGGLPFKPGHRKDYRFIVDKKKLLEPLRKRKPTRIFVESMSDAFGDWWPTSYIDQLYAVMALTPQHTYINLSKRPARRRDYLNDPAWYGRVAIAIDDLGLSPLFNGNRYEAKRALSHHVPLPNVIEGTSVSNQEEADEFVPILLATPAALRGLSCEPLLGPIDLRPKADANYQRLSEWYGPNGFDPNGSQPRRERRSDLFPNLDWVIVGGESGRKARPMHPAWARSIRDQCQAANVAFFFKQWGEFGPALMPGVELARGGGQPDVAWPDGTIAWGTFEEHGGLGESLHRLGKKKSGRLLDGRTWDEFPKVKTAMGEAA